MDNQPITNSTPIPSSPERKRSYTRIIIVLIIILVLMGVVGFFLYYFYRNHAKNVADGPVNICFLVTKSQTITCVNHIGLKPTTYRLPKLANKAQFSYLQSSPNGFQYVALATGSSSSTKTISYSGANNSQSSALVLNGALANPVSIKLPNSDIANYVSWSRDSQSILLTTTNNVANDIYRYNLKNDSLKQLIAGKYIHNLKQLPNGQIIYWQLNPVITSISFVTYVMNSNGTNSHLLFQPKHSNTAINYSYDQASSTLFQIAILPTKNGAISGDLQYGSPTEIAKNSWHKVPGTFPGFITQARLIDGYRLLTVLGGGGAELVNLHTGATAKIPDVNSFIGLLNTASLPH